MSELLVSIIVILIPGIAATIISDKLTTHSKWDSFKFGLYSLMLGVFTYVVLQSVVFIWNVVSAISFKEFSCNNLTIFRTFDWYTLKIWGSTLNGGKGIDAWEICAAFVLSAPVALFAAWLINFKVFNAVARKLKISNKYGDENLFSYYLNAKEIDWIYVRDPDKGHTYQGRIVSFAENEKTQELVLSEVTVFNYEDSALLYTVPTIYLSREYGKISIEAIPTEFLGGNNDGQ